MNFTVGGKFNHRMEAKDGCIGFDFEGRFASIVVKRSIEYTLDGDPKTVIDKMPTEQEEWNRRSVTLFYDSGLLGTK